MTQYNISFVGAGNVARSLIGKLYSCGQKITRVVSVDKKKGESLASSYNALWSSDYLFEDDTDIIIVAVKDSVLPYVLSSIKCHEHTSVVHTAGSYGLEVFPESMKRKGVFYPLQSFTAGRDISFDGLPFLLETDDASTMEKMQDMVASVGACWHLSDVDRRKMFHVAAVFVNNFTNYMLSCGKEIANKADMDFMLLEPLAKETIAKAFANSPEKSLTGPAARKDYNTIDAHIKMLSFDKDLQNLYEEITKSILNR